MPNAPASAAERDALRAAAVRLRDEVSRRIVGQRDVLDEILMAVLAGGHALLVGVPGLAKTLMVRSVAESSSSSSVPVMSLGTRSGVN